MWASALALWQTSDRGFFSSIRLASVTTKVGKGVRERLQKGLQVFGHHLVKGFRLGCPAAVAALAGKDREGRHAPQRGKGRARATGMRGSPK